MQMTENKYSGLVADLLPNIQLMKIVGHYFFRFSSGSTMLSKLYSTMHLLLFLVQYVFLIVNLAMNTSEVNELTANTITVLHFTHAITKFVYVALNGKHVYRTFNIWNQSNSHPLFAESDARYHAIALAKMRKNLYTITTLTVGSCVGESSNWVAHWALNSHWNTSVRIFAAWSTITFFGESVKGVFDKETNETYFVEVPRLPMKSFYPWDAMAGLLYWATFLFQVTLNTEIHLEWGIYRVSSHLVSRLRSTFCCSQCWHAICQTFSSPPGSRSLASNCSTWCTCVYFQYLHGK